MCPPGAEGGQRRPQGRRWPPGHCVTRTNSRLTTSVLTKRQTSERQTARRPVARTSRRGGQAPVSDALRVEKRPDGLCRLRLNRPDKLNALNDELVSELRQVQQRLVGDPETRVVVLSGEGRSFCAGADLTDFSKIHRDPNATRNTLWRLRDVIRGFEELAQPVVGVLHGHVLAGGLELAMGCDILVAARSTLIGDQHIRRNLVPGAGNTQRIPQRLGRTQAMDLLLTGRWVSAEEALSMGLVSRVV